MEALKVYNYSIYGIHCSLCLKKIKGLKSKVEGLESITVDMSRQRLRVEAHKGFNSHSLITETEKLGFEAKEMTPEEAAPRGKRSKNNLLAKVGISGAMTGNIMLLSYAHYLGAPEKFSRFFTVLSGLLFLPVLFYSATPFFVSSWKAIKRRKPHIDLPLAIAILVGSFFSYINLLRGYSEVYFDSLAALVFLILSSRYIVQRFQAKYLSPVSLSEVLPSIRLSIFRDGKNLTADSSEIREGDEFLINKGQIIPVDSESLTRHFMIDNSLITGEEDPISLGEWSKVYAGARLLSQKVRLRAVAGQKTSRVSQIINQLNHALDKESTLVRMTDLFAQYFTFFVFSIGTLFFLSYSFIDINIALNRTLALFVIACPCAIAVTSPLLLRMRIRYFLKKNFLIKNTEVFEKINQCKTIVFDKTGTLTFPVCDKESWTPRKPTEKEALVIFSLEKESDHPLSETIIQSLGLSAPSSLPMAHFEEVSGWGVRASIDGHSFSMSRLEDEESSSGFFKDGELILKFKKRSKLRPEVIQEIKSLKGQGINVYLLTGDNKKNALSTASEICIPESQVFYEVSPEEKNGIVQELSTKENIVYVGDGLNDSLAMSSGFVGISMKRSVKSTFKASDIHIMKDGIQGLAQLFGESREVVKNIKSLIFISLIYNFCFGTLALMGHITPLIASILMPLSSLSLLGIGILYSKRSEA